MHQRRGFTLVEVLVVITVSSVIMGIAVTLLYGLLLTQRTARDHLHRCHELDRLAEQFRRDVHLATTHNGADLTAGWQCHLPADRTVTYRAEPGGLVRVEHQGQVVRQRESFALPPNSVASIEVTNSRKDGRGPAIASLLVTPAGDNPGTSAQGPPAARPVRIDAVLGRDHRFSKPKAP
jgi:prepilin-type N-terminal cleavage/methylation domain-containing protein